MGDALKITQFHPDVLAAHAQFGGDLESMQMCYEWYGLKAQLASLLSERAGSGDAVRVKANDLEEEIMDAIDEYRESIPGDKYGPHAWPTVDGIKDAVRKGIAAALTVDSDRPATGKEGELIRAGAAMACVCFNLSQVGSIPAEARKALKDAQVEWDAARSALTRAETAGYGGDNG